MNVRMQPICQYCGQEARLVTGVRIYSNPSGLRDLKFWMCEPCDAWVGCHKPGSSRRVRGRWKVHVGNEPLGILANAELRQAKSAAHLAFDPHWQTGKMKRKSAYAWLARNLGLSVEQTHIGGFEFAVCMRVVEICRKEASPREMAD